MAAQMIDLPSDQHAPTEKELLRMVLDNAHIHDCAVPGKSVITVLLTEKQIDRLCSYGAPDEDLEDGDDDLDEVVL